MKDDDNESHKLSLLLIKIASPKQLFSLTRILKSLFFISSAFNQYKPGRIYIPGI